MSIYVPGGSNALPYSTSIRGDASGITRESRNLPVYTRLPKSPDHCPLTGLSRSALNELILPTQSNGGRPPVKSVVHKKRHAQRGVRLIEVDSLLAYLANLPSNGKEVA